MDLPTRRTSIARPLLSSPTRATPTAIGRHDRPLFPRERDGVPPVLHPSVLGIRDFDPLDGAAAICGFPPRHACPHLGALGLAPGPLRLRRGTRMTCPGRPSGRPSAPLRTQSCRLTDESPRWPGMLTRSGPPHPTPRHRDGRNAASGAVAFTPGGSRGIASILPTRTNAPRRRPGALMAFRTAPCAAPFRDARKRIEQFGSYSFRRVLVATMAPERACRARTHRHRRLHARRTARLSVSGYGPILSQGTLPARGPRRAAAVRDRALAGHNAAHRGPSAFRPGGARRRGWRAAVIMVTPTGSTRVFAVKGRVLDH